MDYKEKYEQALEVAKKLIENEETNIPVFYVDNIKDIFTELKENEDERIVKCLLNYFNHVRYNGLDLKGTDVNEVIAWLEKQGTLIKEYEDKLDRVSCESFDKGYKAALEKQGGQKETCGWKDGNIIKHGAILALVIKGRRAMKINGEIFTIQYPDEWVKATGGEIEYFFNEFEKFVEEGNYRPWTIQDAKDGDVLYCKSNCGIEYIVMSKGVNDRNNIDSYFRYNSVDGFGVDIPNVLSAEQDNITPATKEQRDLLFQKMKEAGYEWDSEKKELQKSAAWSEEDETGLTNTIIMLKEGASLHFIKKDIAKAVDWLKKLKERMANS